MFRIDKILIQRILQTFYDLRGVPGHFLKIRVSRERYQTTETGFVYGFNKTRLIVKEKNKIYKKPNTNIKICFRIGRIRVCKIVELIRERNRPTVFCNDHYEMIYIGVRRIAPTKDCGTQTNLL